MHLQDAQGGVSSVSSSRLESEFQKNRRGAVHFTVNSTNYEIGFKGASQERAKRQKQKEKNLQKLCSPLNA